MWHNFWLQPLGRVSPVYFPSILWFFSFQFLHILLSNFFKPTICSLPHLVWSVIKWTDLESQRIYRHFLAAPCSVVVRQQFDFAQAPFTFYYTGAFTLCTLMHHPYPIPPTPSFLMQMTLRRLVPLPHPLLLLSFGLLLMGAVVRV